MRTGDKKMENITKNVIGEYNRELSESKEALVRAVIKDLNRNGVKDELIRARVLGQADSYSKKVYISYINSFEE